MFGVQWFALPIFLNFCPNIILINNGHWGWFLDFPPLFKSTLLETTKHRGDCGPPDWMYPRGTVTWKVQRRTGPVVDETAGGCVFTVVLRIQHQPRRRSNHRTATRWMEARRDCSRRSKYLFKQHGAAAGGARNGILSFARAGWRYTAPLVDPP